MPFNSWLCVTFGFLIISYPLIILVLMVALHDSFNPVTLSVKLCVVHRHRISSPFWIWTPNLKPLFTKRRRPRLLIITSANVVYSGMKDTILKKKEKCYSKFDEEFFLITNERDFRTFHSIFIMNSIFPWNYITKSLAIVGVEW